MAGVLPITLLITATALGDAGLVYVQLDKSLSHAAAYQALSRLRLECMGIFDSQRRVHACLGSDDEALLPSADPDRGVLCVSRSACMVVPPSPSPSPTEADPLAYPALDQLKVTYEDCVASLGKGTRQKTLTKPLEWIHIPKCGTSFGATIYGYLCQSKSAPFTNPRDPNVNCTYCGEIGKNLRRGLYWDPKLRNMIPFSNKIRRDGTWHRFSEYYAPYCDWSQTPHPPYSNHFPLHIQRGGKSTNTATLTMFRDPRRRLVSAWNNDKHSYGASGHHRTGPNGIKWIQNISHFVSHPSIPGCQTKMINGRVCADHRPVTDSMLAEAKKRVSDQNTVAFVGLTDAFNASVCLFHHMYGGDPKPYMFQTVGRERSSAFLFANYKDEKKYKPLPGGGDRVAPDTWKSIPLMADQYDVELYRFARDIFVQRLRKFGLMERI